MAESWGFIGHGFDFYHDPLISCSPQLSFPAPPAQPQLCPLYTITSSTSYNASDTGSLTHLWAFAPAVSFAWNPPPALLGGMHFQDLAQKASPGLVHLLLYLQAPYLPLPSYVAPIPPGLEAPEPLADSNPGPGTEQVFSQHSQSWRDSAAAALAHTAVTSDRTILRLDARWMVSNQQQQKPTGQEEPPSVGVRETVQPGSLSPQISPPLLFPLLSSSRPSPHPLSCLSTLTGH